MTFHKPTADLFIPDGTEAVTALARVTQLGIGAHQDDIEFMAIPGILDCFGKPQRPFGGVVCTNGAGSARTGLYAGVSNEEMCRVRRHEQRTAAAIGQYGFVAQLDYTSAEARAPGQAALIADLTAILLATRPAVIYTHNLADKHETHVAVAVAALLAVRTLPMAKRPARMYGCEMWRDLDWLPDTEKAVFDVSAHQNLQAALNGVYDSQIAGGKRYDLAAMGRRRAHATFLDSHAADTTELATVAMDLSPLIQDDTRDIIEYVTAFIQQFAADVRSKLAARLPVKSTCGNTRPNG
ncbi:MAG: PIG-L deacetylase family protein [Kiritimatiellia bacterium]